MPREDDVVILGKPTLKLLGIDVSDSLGARARERAGLTVVDTAAYRQCRRVTVSTDAVQQQTSFTPKEPNEAVERLVARGPEIDMSPEEELRARSEALKGAVQAEAAAGVQDSQVQRLREVVHSRWNAFRRGLRRSDPPARVEPLRVTLKPELGRSRRGRASTIPSRPLGRQRAWPRWQLWGLFSSICRPCWPVQPSLRHEKMGFTY